MTIKELKNKRVTVMGLGKLGGGVGVVKFLAEHGAKLTVTDIKKEEELRDSLAALKRLNYIEFVFGQHRKEDFIDRDFIVKNPGVPRSSPYLRVARERGIPIQTDISLFFQLSTCPVIGVTGTKGKSTTASLIYEFLKESYKTFLAGNIGVSPLGFIEETSVNSLVVLELSSWQLEDLAPFQVSPHIAVVLNIYPDHLNRHPDLSDYIAAKKVICAFQKKEDTSILNYDDERVREFASETAGSVLFFSQKKSVEGVFVKEGKVFFYGESEALISEEEVLLEGAHNLSNMLAAIGVARTYKIRAKAIRNVLKTFKGIPYRQELIREIHGITFYNDTTATIPQATIAALKRFGPNTILIAGGQDKGLDYSELAEEIEKRVKFLILLPGDASEKISAKLKAHFAAQGSSAAKAESSKVPIETIENMEEAVKKAFQHASTGDIIILSPAATSFNLFTNEFERGEQFNNAVKAL